MIHQAKFNLKNNFPLILLTITFEFFRERNLLNFKQVKILKFHIMISKQISYEFIYLIVLLKIAIYHFELILLSFLSGFCHISLTALSANLRM